MISDILTHKKLAGWSCGETYESLVWDAELAGREKPTEAEIEAWIAEYEPLKTIATLEAALDRHLDAVANSYRYESIRTMVTYATSDHASFGPEGRAAVAFRDAVYSYGIAKIEACTREVDPEPIPTEAQLIAGCPVFETFLQP